MVCLPRTLHVPVCSSVAGWRGIGVQLERGQHHEAAESFNLALNLSPGDDDLTALIGRQGRRASEQPPVSAQRACVHGVPRIEALPEFEARECGVASRRSGDA
jgi:hypothetical protein